MTTSSTVRTPPRRRSARRIVAAFAIALALLPISAGRVEAYPCSYMDGARILSSDCAPPKREPKKHVPGEPNVVSLALFVAALLGVLAIPITYSRQGTADPK
jgi:hypothetical protein